ncbi:hypothetical protein D3C85_1841380 [compost metagenome]
MLEVCQIIIFNNIHIVSFGQLGNGFLRGLRVGAPKWILETRHRIEKLYVLGTEEVF